MPTLPQQMTQVNSTATPPATLPANFNFNSPVSQAQTGNAPATLPANFNFGTQAQPQSQDAQNVNAVKGVLTSNQQGQKTFDEAASNYKQGLYRTYAGAVGINPDTGEWGMPDFLKEAQSSTNSNPVARLEENALSSGGSLLNLVFAPFTQAISSISTAMSDNPRVQQAASTSLSKLADAGQAITDLQNTHPEASKNINNALSFLLTAGSAGGLDKPVGNVFPKSTNPSGPTSFDHLASETPEEGAPPVPKTPEVDPKTQNVIDTRTQGLQSVVDRYVSVSNAVDTATNKGFSPLEDIASDDRFVPEVDKNGTIDSSRAIKNLNDYVKPIALQERAAIEAEGKSVSYDKFTKEVTDELNSSNLRERGGSYDTIQARVEKDLEVYKREFAEGGTIDLTKLDDIKDAKYRIVNWNNEDAQIADKIVARAAHQVVIDNVTGADIDALNKKMSQYYSARDVLDAMDGKKVQGGRLGKYFARTIGSIAGSHFGPFGTIAGGEVASRIKGTLMQNKFGKPNAGLTLEKPDILTQTENALSTPAKQLKAPTETVSGKVFDTYNSLPNKSGGFFKIAKNIHPDDLGTMRDFTDYVNGSYKPSQQAIVNLEIAARRIAEKYGITDSNVSNKILANNFGKVLDAKLNLSKKSKSQNLP